MLIFASCRLVLVLFLYVILFICFFFFSLFFFFNDTATTEIYTLSLHDALPICYRLEVVSYDDLTIDLAHRMGARFLVRGVRSAKDFEYEREQADINKQLGGVETILLFSDRSEEHTSELQSRGHLVCRLLLEKKKKNKQKN